MDPTKEPNAAEAWQEPESGFAPGQGEGKPAEDVKPEVTPEEQAFLTKIEES